MNVLRYFLLVLVFFPSVTFGVLSAEIFPWAILFGIFSIRFVRMVDVLAIPLLTFLFLSALWSLAFTQDSDALRSFAAYCNAIVAFVAFLTMSQVWFNYTIKIAKNVLIFLLILGILQYSGGLHFIDGLLSVLVPRASGGALVELGGRGVTLLSSEPSRAGVEIVYLYLIFRMTQPVKKRPMVGDLLLIVYLVFVIKGAQPLAFGVFVIGLIIVKSPIQATLVALALLAIPFLSIDIGGSRVLSLLENVFEQDNLAAAIFFLANESGHRLITIYSFFFSGVTHPLGRGVGSWPVSSIQAIQETGFDYNQLRYFQIRGGGDLVGVRGSGVLSNMMLDIGIFGTGFFLYWIFAVTKRLRVRDKNTLLIMLVLLVKISFFGSIGEPLPWVATALLLRYNFDRKTRDIRAQADPCAQH